MKFKVSAVLPMPAEAYFVERDSAAFRSLVAQTCKLEALEMGNSWMQGDTEVYEFVTKPDIERYVPAQFKHFVPGGDLHYTDVIEYDPKLIARSPYKMRVHSIPPIFANKEVTKETCRQTLEGEIEIKILGLGHIAERIIVDNLKGVYKGVPKIVERWAQFRAEVLKQPGGKEILVQGRPKNDNVDWISDRMKSLIQAPLDSDSDTASVISSEPYSDHRGDSPSVDELVAACSLNVHDDEGEDDEDEFFDARENSSWANLDDFLGGREEVAGSSVHRDALDAKQSLTAVTRGGRKIKKVEVDATHKSGVPNKDKLKNAVQSSRFSKTYNQDLAEWKDFWQDHRLPESKHTPDMKRRLGNLFGVGAAVGLFKADNKHHRLHLHRRHKKDKEKHNRTESTATAGSSTGKSTHSLASHITEVSEESELSKPRVSMDDEGHKHGHRHSKDKGQGHRPSKSAAFVTHLFGKKKHHEKDNPANPARHSEDLQLDR